MTSIVTIEIVIKSDIVRKTELKLKYLKVIKLRMWITQICDGTSFIFNDTEFSYDNVT